MVYELKHQEWTIMIVEDTILTSPEVVNKPPAPQATHTLLPAFCTPGLA